MPRRTIPPVVLALAVGFATLCVAPPTSEALTVAEDEDTYELSLSLFGQAEYGVRDSVFDNSLQYGPNVSLARIKGAAEWHDVGGLTIQVGGSSGDIRLVDLVATVDEPLGPVSVRIGRFKTPISAEYLVSAPDLVFVNRALTANFIPRRRIGAETAVSFGEADGVQFKGQLGLFQPQDTSFPNPQGQLLTARLLLGLPMGLNFHAGFAEHLFAENVNPTDGGRLVELERPLDFAVYYDKDRLNLHAEGVVVLNSPGSTSLWALYGHAAYRFGKDGELNVEPAVGYDHVNTQPRLHRLTAGANLYLFDTPLVATANYRLYTTGDLGHAAFIQLQGSI